MFICELLDLRGVEVATYWNIVAQNWALLFISTVFHRPWSSGNIILPIVYFASRLCWDSKQAFQYNGSVAYLFPLTVAAVFEGGAVHIFQSIDTSHFEFYCTREDKIIYTGKCFHCDCAIGKESLSGKFIHLLLEHCRDRTYGRSTVIISEVLQNYFTASAGSGSAGLELF